MNRIVMKWGFAVALILTLTFTLKRFNTVTDKGGVDAPAIVASDRSKPWTGSYHAGPPSEALPDVLPTRQFAGDPETACAYRLAAQIKPILYQMPCGCSCDRQLGHKSLFDCFRTRHGQECEICRREAIYVYVQRSGGGSPEQIREEVERGMWQGVNVAEACRQVKPRVLRKSAQ
jgi:hypothetical protein